MFQQLLVIAKEKLATIRGLENPRVYAIGAAVAVLHVALIWVLASGLVVPKGDDGQGREMQVALLPGVVTAQPQADPPPEPTLQAADPTPPEITAPEIDVDMSAASSLAGLSTADILPPRPDPVFQNISPSLPASFAKGAKEVVVMLTVLVQADGSISDTRVAQSSGQSALDQLAAAFAKAKWRFRAAMQNGHPVSDWTTVLVRFAS